MGSAIRLSWRHERERTSLLKFTKARIIELALVLTHAAVNIFDLCVEGRTLEARGEILGAQAQVLLEPCLGGEIGAADEVHNGRLDATRGAT